MENLLIKKVAEADNASLAKLIRDVFDEYDAPKKCTVYSDPTTDDLYRLFKKEGSVLWVAWVDNNILGCCGVYPTEGLENDTAELAKFYLLKESRGLGIGKKLMEQCFKSAQEMEYKRLYLESMPQFSKAVSMYEKYGFKMLDKALGNSGHTSCNIWMFKEFS